MKLSLEKANKIILLAALIALIYREGNFAVTFIPKPFETTLVLLCFSTLFFLLKNGKVKDFFASIPRNILIALCVLIGSVFLGWFSAFLSGTPTSFNMILELGTFLMGFATFLLVLFYTKGDDGYAKRCLYALLVPSIYAILLFLFPLDEYLGVNFNEHFLGLTGNPNIISKILLVPAMFFISYSLFEFKQKHLRFLYIFIASTQVALILWTASRGALVSLILGSTFALAMYVFYEFSWKKIFTGMIIIAGILVMGFALVPSASQKAIRQRVVMTIAGLTRLPPLVAETPERVLEKVKMDQDSAKLTAIKPDENRLIIWPFYIKYVLLHPLGMGPNTHKNFKLTDRNGYSINSGPHNTYMQIWLWGGVLGVLSFLYILFLGFKNLRNRLKLSLNKTDLALFAILLALSVSIFFDDSLSFYWFFIILALSLRNTITN